MRRRNDNENGSDFLEPQTSETVKESDKAELKSFRSQLENLENEMLNPV